MCGIAGFANISKTNFEVDENLLLSMQEKIKHRGPDGFGIWKNDQGMIGLAHRRLSIIDLSSAASQPMENQTATISFNGEIYNHLKIRDELEKSGYKYFSRSDTETILNAYEKWGIESLHLLDGEFAFALYDKTKNDLYLVRDRIGVKPIYFSLQGGILSFASEIKAFDALPWIKKETSEHSLYHYLTFMVAPAPLTIYKNIYKLPAGFYLKLDKDKNISFKEWYSPIQNQLNDNTQYNDENFCIEEIRRLLNEAVKKRMIADVPVGVFLSGGIDSSLNVALMAQHKQKINTYTIAFSDEPNNDERAWARKVSEKFATNHHEVEISEKEAFEFFQKMIYFNDEPLADCVSIPLYYISKKAQEDGIKAVQIGEGADELFFGYPLYATYAKIFNGYAYKLGNKVPSFIKQNLSKLLNIFFKNQSTQEEFIFNWGNSNPIFFGGAIAFGEKQKSEFIKKNSFIENSLNDDVIVRSLLENTKIEFDSAEFINFHLKNLLSKSSNADFGTQIAYLELKQRIPELLLMRADKMMMAASLEARVPFLDYKLVEFMLKVPLELKFKNNETKYLLKKACEGILPSEIIYRKKIGFGAPTLRWYKEGKYFPTFFQEKIPSIKKSINENLIDWNKVINEKSTIIGVQKWTLQNLSNLGNK